MTTLCIPGECKAYARQRVNNDMLLENRSCAGSLDRCISCEARHLHLQPLSDFEIHSRSEDQLQVCDFTPFCRVDINLKLRYETAHWLDCLDWDDVDLTSQCDSRDCQRGLRGMPHECICVPAVGINVSVLAPYTDHGHDQLEGGLGAGPHCNLQFLKRKDPLPDLKTEGLKEVRPDQVHRARRPRRDRNDIEGDISQLVVGRARALQDATPLKAREINMHLVSCVEHLADRKLKEDGAWDASNRRFPSSH